MTEVETVIYNGLGYPALSQRTVSGLRHIAGVQVWSPELESAKWYLIKCLRHGSETNRVISMLP